MTWAFAMLYLSHSLPIFCCPRFRLATASLCVRVYSVAVLLNDSHFARSIGTAWAAFDVPSLIVEICKCVLVDMNIKHAFICFDLISMSETLQYLLFCHCNIVIHTRTFSINWLWKFKSLNRLINYADFDSPALDISCRILSLERRTNDNNKNNNKTQNRCSNDTKLNTF